MYLFEEQKGIRRDIAPVSQALQKLFRGLISNNYLFNCQNIVILSINFVSWDKNCEEEKQKSF